MFVVGTLARKRTGNDIYVARYSATGKRILSVNVVGANTTGSSDFGTAIARAGNGELYLAGTSVGASGTPDAVALCLKATGRLKWSTYVDGAGGDDWGADIAVGPHTAYLTGQATMGTYGLDFLMVGLAR